ncbi:MAG: Fe-S assembly protein IscX [Gammaproteobacteria bacterium TMED112]|nr:MAG: Fe-S assembly protein IscX [Gammaproteobacteria bacterium TMED112]|tara:strand:+ start:14796 stop:14993 length:198 start_codon:yes stop_codon:yes gene_type:complete
MLKWVDTLDIAIELSEKHPDIDPQWINFVDLRKLVVELEDFDDIPDKVNEKILESIQQNWIKEID